MPKMKPIKACPFCGHDAVIEETWIADYFWVQCQFKQCHGTGPYRKTREGAIAAWNSRVEIR